MTTGGGPRPSVPVSVSPASEPARLPTGFIDIANHPLPTIEQSPSPEPRAIRSKPVETLKRTYQAKQARSEPSSSYVVQRPPNSKAVRAQRRAATNSKAARTVPAVSKNPPPIDPNVRDALGWGAVVHDKAVVAAYPPLPKDYVIPSTKVLEQEILKNPVPRPPPFKPPPPRLPPEVRRAWRQVKRTPTPTPEVKDNRIRGWIDGVERACSVEKSPESDTTVRVQQQQQDQQRRKGSPARASPSAPVAYPSPPGTTPADVTLEVENVSMEDTPPASPLDIVPCYVDLDGTVYY
ncbi:hypothetical protein HKX48_005225 [Thoreauomyces humboldtii]|nr:hypothetical protein HKX48_005225 [Thoreauomyces humboldtii]